MFISIPKMENESMIISYCIFSMSEQVVELWHSLSNHLKELTERQVAPEVKILRINEEKVCNWRLIQLYLQVYSLKSNWFYIW